MYQKREIEHLENEQVDPLCKPREIGRTASPWKCTGKGACWTRLVFFAFIASLFIPATVCPMDEKILFREDFQDLSKWKNEFFPKIPEHTIYRIEKENGESYLMAHSDHSASLLIYTEPFDVYDFPDVRWRWKIDGIIENGNAKTKQGDDYPIRIYIAFAYDSEKSGLIERAQYAALRALYGEYPPHSSLNYIWANHLYEETILDSPYTSRSKMILLEKGNERAGTWVTEEINIIKDYEAAFGRKPPGKATIGIMNDSDNTSGQATSYIDYIMVYRNYLL